MKQKQFEDRELLIDFSSPLSTLRTDLNPANFYFKFNNRKIWVSILLVLFKQLLLISLQLV